MYKLIALLVAFENGCVEDSGVFFFQILFVEHKDWHYPGLIIIALKEACSVKGKNVLSYKLVSI